MKPLRLNALSVVIFAFALTVDLSLPSVNAQSISQPGATVDAATRAEVIEGALNALNDEYVFPETAKKMEQAVREQARRKEYDGVAGAADFAAALTRRLQEVNKDKHLRVIFDDGSRPASGGWLNPMDRERARMMSAKRNFGFEKVERLGGNIGYLDLRGFEDPDFAADTAAAAMSFLANTDALIIDLRRNGGGQLKSMIESLRSELGDAAPPASSQPPARQIASAASQGSKPASTETGGEMIELPDTPAGKALGEFIKAFNSGDLETLKRFHRERGGDEENARRDIEFYQESSGLRIHSVTQPGQFEIEVLAQMKKGDRWVSFAVGVEPQAPYGIADIRIRPASAPGAKSGERGATAEPGKEKLSEAGLIERLNAIIEGRKQGD